MEKLNIKAFVAEIIGTFTLVFFGCGTACVVGCDVKGGYLATALAFGLVIVAMAYAIGGISGCHINPAVTLGVLINKGISVQNAVGYWISQFIGGIAGGAVLKVILPDACAKALGSNDIYDGSFTKTFIIEAILTFVFILTILGVTSSKKESHLAGLVIGGALTLVHLLGIKLTGTSVNPARSLGVAIFATDKIYISHVWIFIVAPLAGAALAAGVWKLLYDKSKN